MKPASSRLGPSRAYIDDGWKVGESACRETWSRAGRRAAEGPKRRSSLSHLEDVVEALQADGGHVEVDAAEAAQHRDTHEVRLVLHLERAEGARQVGRLEVRAEARLVDDDDLPRWVARLPRAHAELAEAGECRAAAVPVAPYHLVARPDLVAAAVGAAARRQDGGRVRDGRRRGLVGAQGDEPVEDAEEAAGGAGGSHAPVERCHRRWRAVARSFSTIKRCNLQQANHVGNKERRQTRAPSECNYRCHAIRALQNYRCHPITL